MTAKKTQVNIGFEAWRGSNATHDGNNKGRQRVRMQYILQSKRSDAVAQTIETVEYLECDCREHEQRFSKALDEDVKIGDILALAPSEVQTHCHLNPPVPERYAQVGTMLTDCCQWLARLKA